MVILAGYQGRFEGEILSFFVASPLILRRLRQELRRRMGLELVSGDHP
jgi:hypothetical protein